MYSEEPLAPPDTLAPLPDPGVPTTVQLTFHYVNGQTEAFNVYFPIDPLATAQDVRQEINRLLRENWWVIKTADQTVFINSANVLKVELEPPMAAIEGDAVFSYGERVTALHRYR